MSNKNEVFEYLIDQLRRQLPVVDVMGEIKRWSIDRSIAGRGNYTDEENAVIDAYIGLEHNPYKQQCEDLAHEVQSLKNQLNDYSRQIKDLLAERAETDLMWEKCLDNTATKTLKTDEWEKTIHRNVEGHVIGITYGKLPEQSGCRKGDVQECEHDYRLVLWCSDLQQCTKCRKLK